MIRRCFCVAFYFFALMGFVSVPLSIYDACRGSVHAGLLAWTMALSFGASIVIEAAVDLRRELAPINLRWEAMKGHRKLTVIAGGRAEERKRAERT